MPFPSRSHHQPGSGRPRHLLNATVLAIGVGLLALLAVAVWPRPADPTLDGAYARLDGSPVPVLLPYTPNLNPSAAQVEADGYVVSVQDADAGPVTMSGRLASPADSPAPGGGDVRVRGLPARLVTRSAQGANAPGTTDILWREGGAVYSLSFGVPPDPDRVARLTRRVVTLEVARRAALGDRWDTPLLYLLYLPLFAGFGAWALASFLRRPVPGRPDTALEETPAAA